jgi:sugar phosphate isomerase/epimerase
MRDTIEMAREAGFPFNKYGLLQGDGDGEIDAEKMFKAFEALVRADEREACAKVCAEMHLEGDDNCGSAADAIRARGETK